METRLTAECTVRQTFDLVTKKWVALIIVLLSEHPHRFGELHYRLDGISQKVLTGSLRALEEYGIISRSVDSKSVPIKVTYSLTPLGESLSVPMNAMREWSENHGTELHRD